MLEIRDADSAEHAGGSRNLVVAPVACPVPNRAPRAPKLSGKSRIRLRPGSRVHEIYGEAEIEEGYSCNYELNPQYQPQLEAAGLQLTGLGENGEARVAELLGNSFFIVTPYQPPLSSTREKPHPLIVAFLEAAARRPR